MKKTPSINVFNAGELGHYEDVRIDKEYYDRGCRIVENVLPAVEGPVRRIPGTKFTNETTGEFGLELGYGISAMGFTPKHMILDGNIVYIVGSRLVTGSRYQCVLKCILIGLTLRHIMHQDYDLGDYWAISSFGDYLYVSGIRTVSGTDPAVHRKLYKSNLAVVWTREKVLGLDICFSRVAAQLLDGYVYTGNWVGGIGGHLLKLNDDDGTIDVEVVSGFEPGSVHFPPHDPTFVDFAGCISGVRRITRRLKSDLSLVANYNFSGDGFYFGENHADTFYYLVSRHVIGANDYSAITKIVSEDLSQSWNVDWNMIGAFNFEQLTGIKKEGTMLYGVGRTYSGVPANDRGIIVKVDEDGGSQVSYLYTIARAILAAVFLTTDYLCVASWSTGINNPGYFEWRSKTDFSLIQELAI